MVSSDCPKSNTELPPFVKTKTLMKNKNNFVDPIRVPWVGIGIFILLCAMIPIWPITGNWYGVPAWAVFALLISILASLFIAFVILWVWHDPDDEVGHDD
jgi:hypothetical protein